MDFVVVKDAVALVSGAEAVPGCAARVDDASEDDGSRDEACTSFRPGYALALALARKDMH